VLFCGDVPQGTVIWVMEGDAESSWAGTRTACRTRSRPSAVLRHWASCFDCAARRAILGDEGILAEMQTIAAYFRASGGGSTLRARAIIT